MSFLFYVFKYSVHSNRGWCLAGWGMLVATDLRAPRRPYEPLAGVSGKGTWEQMPLGWLFQHIQNSSSEADSFTPSAVGYLTHHHPLKESRAFLSQKQGGDTSSWEQFKWLLADPVILTGSGRNKHANASETHFLLRSQKTRERG